VRALIAALPARVQMVVKVADSTGLRISEILGLRWKNADLVTGWLRVRERYYRGDQDVTKSERSVRDVPLGHLLEEFRALKPASASGEAFVFDRGDGMPYDDRGLLQHFIRPAAKALGFYWEGFGFHSFRRENNTKMQEEGASATEAQRHLGHSQPSMTGEYTILQKQRHEELVKRVQERWMEPATGAVN
jgi:integrase